MQFFLIMMSKRAGIKVEKGAGSNPSLTKSACRRNPRTTTYPQPDRFESQLKYLKGFLFDCLGGYNTETYLTSMKEVSECICRKFDYGADIQRSLKNNKKTKIPLPSRPIGTEADGSLSLDQNFIWEKKTEEIVKCNTKMDKNF